MLCIQVELAPSLILAYSQAHQFTVSDLDGHDGVPSRAGFSSHVPYKNTFSVFRLGSYEFNRSKFTNKQAVVNLMIMILVYLPSHFY